MDEGDAKLEQMTNMDEKINCQWCKDIWCYIAQASELLAMPNRNPELLFIFVCKNAGRKDLPLFGKKVVKLCETYSLVTLRHDAVPSPPT